MNSKLQSISYNALNDVKPHLKPPKLPTDYALQKEVSPTAKVYSHKQINNLLNNINKNNGENLIKHHYPEIKYQQGDKLVRFAISYDPSNKNKRLQFGQEGDPSKTIPSHYQLCHVKNPKKAWAITAGNIIFDKNGNICAITNKSGDYKFPFSTLLYALKYIEKSQLNFAENITFLDERNRNNSTPLIISKMDLFKFLKQQPKCSYLDNEIDNAYAKDHQYNSNHNNNISKNKYSHFKSHDRNRLTSIDSVLYDDSSAQLIEEANVLMVREKYQSAVFKVQEALEELTNNGQHRRARNTAQEFITALKNNGQDDLCKYLEGYYQKEVTNNPISLDKVVKDNSNSKNCCSML